MRMAKPTKAQAKRMVTSIKSKATRLFLHDMGMTSNDYLALDRIMTKVRKRLK